MLKVLYSHFLLLLIFYAPVSFTSDLPSPADIYFEYISKGNFLTPFIELKDHEQEYLTSPLKMEFLDTLGVLHSNIGNYSEALKVFDTMRPPPKPWPLVNFGNARPVKALSMIEEVAALNSVIFINEAHHVPQHRAFSILVLKKLYKQGFRYFAAETLGSSDKELSLRGYPLIFKTGYYTNEPVFGDLIRTALRLGFRVIPYESTTSCKQPENGNIFYCQNVRERAQAENLYKRIFKDDPKAKVIVHAGYGHIDERGWDGWKPMAKIFKELTGIDPFTIDQVEMTEHSSVVYENPYYRKAVNELNLSEPLIFKLKNGNSWVEPPRQGAYDAQVFHPKSQYQNGRPDWLLTKGLRNQHLLRHSICNSKFPCLVQAFIETEGDSAVPIDMVMITESNEAPALALPEGDFRIKAIAPNGETTSVSTIHVE